ncbi:unnamed protein product [Lepeophtheirus salmonis]|uniref:(salmon louse) hypothetical protein n=1 Tax=Lepeophtheirus salmonis TaxID=72036 RepID=A0A7R8D6D9_LEPSM|nr:unnamed protein product [Lepeophtheirus salmonis]CAF2988648.1 unnamed protein product [Lepeophtheirus salmonis]
MNIIDNDQHMAKNKGSNFLNRGLQSEEFVFVFSGARLKVEINYKERKRLFSIIPEGSKGPSFDYHPDYNQERAFANYTSFYTGIGIAAVLLILIIALNLFFGVFSLLGIAIGIPALLGIATFSHSSSSDLKIKALWIYNTCHLREKSRKLSGSILYCCSFNRNPFLALLLAVSSCLCLLSRLAFDKTFLCLWDSLSELLHFLSLKKKKKLKRIAAIVGATSIIASVLLLKFGDKLCKARHSSLPHRGLSTYLPEDNEMEMIPSGHLEVESTSFQGEFAI